MPELSFHSVVDVAVQLDRYAADHRTPAFDVLNVIATNVDGVRVTLKLFAAPDADLVGQLRETVYRVPA